MLRVVAVQILFERNFQPDARSFRRFGNNMNIAAESVCAFAHTRQTVSIAFARNVKTFAVIAQQ